LAAVEDPPKADLMPTSARSAAEERQNIVARNDLRTFKSCVNNQPKLFQLKTPLIIEQTDVFI